MLAQTELPFAFEVDDVNLLQIRPQYTKKEYQNYKKYDGPHFNSELWTVDNNDLLEQLIKSGLEI